MYLGVSENVKTAVFAQKYIATAVNVLQDTEADIAIDVSANYVIVDFRQNIDKFVRNASLVLSTNEIVK